MKLFIFLSLAVAAYAVCPNKCSGHGTCGSADRCSCFPNWQGSDCADRTCAFGLSWVTTANADDNSVPAGSGLGGRHAYAECSSKGVCDRGSGLCKCFDGYEGKGCRRSVCPNKCSGHGRCVYNRDVHSQSTGGYTEAVNGYDGYNLEGFTKGFDAGKTQQCMCDRGWEDVDCSSRICPKGDDPLTDCISKNQKDDVQLILFRGADEFDLTNNAQFFTLTFTDMFNGNYTTYPIQLNSKEKDSGGALCNNGAASADACFAGTDSAIEAALKALPNFAIPNVDVTYQNFSAYREALGTAGSVAFSVTDAAEPTQFAGSGDTGDTMDAATIATADVITGFLVTFNHAANSGKQELLDCYVGSQYDSDEPASQPRFGLGGSSLGIGCDVYHVGEPVDNQHFGSAAQQTLLATTLEDGTAGTTANDLTGAERNYDSTFGTGTANVYTSKLQLDVVPYDSNSAYKEHAACSNRGKCDGSSGLCECYDGFTGESCDTQHAFF